MVNLLCAGLLFVGQAPVARLGAPFVGPVPERAEVLVQGEPIAQVIRRVQAIYPIYANVPREQWQVSEDGYLLLLRPGHIPAQFGGYVIQR